MSAIQSPLLAEAVAILARGGLVAFPTETVYGLGADAGNPAALRRLFAVKRRPVAHPLIVHIASVSELEGVARHVSEIAARLAARFWPGPLTLIVPRGERVPLEVTGGQETVAVRVPQHPLALALLESFGAGIAAPSANRFGAVSPTRAEHVRRDLGDEVELVLDGGPCEIGLESTIVDVSQGTARLLRPGGVPVEAIETELGQRLTPSTDPLVRAPGQLPSHYAPRAELLVVSAAELESRAALLTARGARLAVLAPLGTTIPRVQTSLLVPADPRGYAHVLYDSLRALDDQGGRRHLGRRTARAGAGSRGRGSTESRRGATRRRLALIARLGRLGRRPARRLRPADARFRALSAADCRAGRRARARCEPARRPLPGSAL